MKIAFFILCHKQPEQVEHLVRRLDHPDHLFVVHVDDRAQDSISSGIRQRLSGLSNVHFAKRQRCYWGGFGIVEATLSCIKEGLRHPIDRAFLVSGQDYPIKSIEQMRSFLSAHQKTEFIESFSLIKPNRWSEQADIYSSTSRASDVFLKFRNRTLSLPVRIKTPLGLEPHGGSQWWCLTREAISYILDFARRHPSIPFYYRFKHIPDELFFQTILSNSPFSECIEAETTFADWHPPQPPYPKILDLADLDRLLGLPTTLFARKFEWPLSLPLAQAIDERVG